MTILLSTSPHIKHSAVLEADFKPRADLMYTFAPLGLLSLCSAVRERNNITPILYDINDRINRNIIRFNDLFYASAADDILSLNPDVVGFMTECDSYHHVLQFSLAIKKARPSCYVILGGPHATAVAEDTMKEWPAIDCIVMGEGEITFPEVIDQLLLQREGIVPGTIMRDRDGIPRKGSQRPLMESLDDLPFPAYDLYNPLLGEEIYLEVGRGCPFQCTFCSTSPFWQRRHRVKSPRRIVEEIRRVQSIFPVERIHFTHDLFTASPNWVREVCSSLVESNLNIRWTCSSRVDTIDENLVALMAQAGCNAIFFGVESGSPGVLEKIEKNISWNQTLDAIQWCHEHNITPNVGLIIGFPFETEQSFRETFAAYTELIRKGARPVHLFSYCPFVQSSLYGSLEDLVCSGHFLDIPLPGGTDGRNREMIRGNYRLFSSYFRPRLEQEITCLKEGMVYAIDEFALLVDCNRFASTFLSVEVGGMDNLFLLWVEYISQLNKRMGKPGERIYYGGPVEFCWFLSHVIDDRRPSNPYLSELVAVFRKNFEIASGLKASVPTTMAGYKSRLLPSGFHQVNMNARVSINSVIDTLEVKHDFIALLDNHIPDGEIAVAAKDMYLVWQKDSGNNVSLISVNSSIYHLVHQAMERSITVQDMLAQWMQLPVAGNMEAFFDSLQEACSRDLISFNEKL